MFERDYPDSVKTGRDRASCGLRGQRWAGRCRPPPDSTAATAHITVRLGSVCLLCVYLAVVCSVHSYHFLLKSTTCGPMSLRLGSHT